MNSCFDTIFHISICMSVHVPTQQKGKVCSYVCIYMSICTAFRQKFCRMYDQENESSDSKTHQLRWQSTDGDENVSYVTFSSRCTPLPEVPTAPTGALTCPCSLSPSCHAGDLSAAPSWTPLQSPGGCRGGIQELLAIWQLRNGLQDTKEGFHIY